MAGTRTPLLDDEAIAILEATARDETLRPTARLRALELLERWRRAAGQDASAPAGAEQAPDPMADLDDLERQRQIRARKAS